MKPTIDHFDAIDVVRSTYNSLTIPKFSGKILNDERCKKDRNTAFVCGIFSLVFFILTLYAENIYGISFALIASFWAIRAFLFWTDAVSKLVPEAFVGDENQRKGRHMNNIYPRYILFRNKCELEFVKSSFSIDANFIGQIHSIMKSEREYDDVEWGISDVIRKSSTQFFVTSILCLVFFFLTNLELSPGSIGFLKDTHKFINRFGFGTLILLVLLVAPLINCFLSIQEKKKDRELLMFISWWKETR